MYLAREKQTCVSLQFTVCFFSMFIVLAYYNIYPSRCLLFNSLSIVFDFSSKCLRNFWYVEIRDGTVKLSKQ